MNKKLEQLIKWIEIQQAFVDLKRTAFEAQIAFEKYNRSLDAYNKTMAVVEAKNKTIDDNQSK